MELKQRFAHADFIAEQYTRFEDFAFDGMVFLGFPLTEIQSDIVEYMEHGPRLRMVMAQRGEAKSTLAALYAVWRIIQRPSTRVLIVSGGETQASEVATLVIRVIMNWDILEYLRPDKSMGDKTSIEGFDVHYALRTTVDKSPSVACIGITAQLQGKRADLLLADDVETTKNGLTMTQRAHLRLLTQEFSSICINGDILYLGTPQSKDSVYNTLPGRGYLVRIWPGRYPNDEELEKYGDKLAPIIADRLKTDPSLRIGGGIDGTRGKPTDPQ
ncbi:MAG: phage terminase large subunit, partial [Burkholderiales bacterium]